jgi:ubiquinone/menaquinone biosynthesis C-methylase UbiE
MGYEPNSNAQTIAKQKGIGFVESFSEIENHSLDVITMWHVLEHVPNLEEQILELKRMLKNDGTLIVAVPNYKSLDAQTYQDYWAAYDVPIHFWHFSKRSIELIFSEFNMELVNVLPMKFDSFYVSMLSEKYKNGKINYLKSISNGLKSNRYGNRENEYSSHIYILKNQ